MVVKKLISLPKGMVPHFHKLEQKNNEEWFCDSDPEGKKAGSGGATAHLLQAAYSKSDFNGDFKTWLISEKHLVIHSAGESRRLPAYESPGLLQDHHVFIASVFHDFFEHHLTAAHKGNIHRNVIGIAIGLRNLPDCISKNIVGRPKHLQLPRALAGSNSVCYNHYTEYRCNNCTTPLSSSRT